ncbi:MAG: hypothetical protein ACMVY4_00975 [Minwuia sp.]|uniref:hypothetical protein n=1 Tax=Minwuia sp. TaxID=2493630 RepID=UPI003A899C6C
MKISRNSRLAAALAALLCALPVVAGAQNQGPRILRPQVQEPQPEQPRRFGDIEVNRLEAPGRVAAGVLTERDGGLPASLWSGSDRETVALLLQRMPGHYRSAAARDLARRLLLSTGEIAPGAVDDNVLLAARMDALVRLGDAEGAIALAEAAGGGIDSQAVAEPLARALFAQNETERACDTVQGQIVQGARGFWQRASVFCDLLSGQRESAEVMRAVLAETGQSDDAFARLADALTDKRPLTFTASPETGVLHAAMLSALESAVLKNAEQLPPHVARMLATAPGIDADGRIAAGVRAARQAGLSPSVVMFLFGGKAGPAGGEFRDPVVAAMSADSTVTRAEALRTLWARASESGDHQLAAAFASGLLRQLEPQSGTTFLAPEAFRMHLLLDDERGARSWLTAMNRAAAAGDPELRAAAAATAPLAQIAGFEAVDDAALEAMAAAAAEPADRQRALLALMLLDALGTPAGPDVWRNLLAAPVPSETPARDPALWRQLVMASGGGQLGEGVQAALALTGTDGPAGLDVSTVSTVVGALRRMGLEDAARRLAVEAFIGNGG